MKKRLKVLFFTLLLAILTTSCLINISNDNNHPVAVNLQDELKVHFIDVGQADCIFIELPNNEEVLIDAGNTGDAETIINYIENLNIDDIEYFIITHPHEDHMGSAAEIINNISIEKVYVPDITADTKFYRNTMAAVENNDVILIKAKAGLTILETPEISFKVLAPSSMYYSEMNEYSLVTKLIYNDSSFLFTGDAESVSELEMIRKGYDLDSDLLKVGHHGGRTSSSMDFLNAVTPEYAVIPSEKDNSYGHPHKETLQRLTTIGSKIYRMDELSTIVATSDGKNITLSNPSESLLQKSAETDSQKIQYIGNKNTRKFHISSCSSIKDMKKSNQITFYIKQDALKEGYEPCSICKP